LRNSLLYNFIHSYIILIRKYLSISFICIHNDLCKMYAIFNINCFINAMVISMKDNIFQRYIRLYNVYIVKQQYYIREILQVSS
jgi:hypothetical protein